MTADEPTAGGGLRTVILYALIGSVIVVAGAIADVHHDGYGWLGLVQPGADGPSAEVFALDFPDERLAPGLGHDGQQMYAIARSPTDLDLIADQLDTPRYRLQRPLFPALAWLLHPVGGGWGLVASIAVVGAASLLLLGVAAGALSLQLGGGAWPAAIAPVLPGSFVTFRLGLADTLALALFVCFVLASERGRGRTAVLCAIGSVLSREVLLAMIVGQAIVRRRRVDIAAAAASTAAIALWWVVLYLAVEQPPSDDGSWTSGVARQFTWPLGGIHASLDLWTSGVAPIAAVSVIGGTVLAVVLLIRRGPRHPLFGGTLVFGLLTTTLAPVVLAGSYNGPRTVGPLILMTLLMVATPTTQEREGDRSEAPKQSTRMRR